MTDDKQKLADVVGGAEVSPLKPGDTAIGGVMLLKILTAEGKMSWAMRHYGDLSQVELIGALTVTLDREQSEYLDGWEEDGDDA